MPETPENNKVIREIMRQGRRLPKKVRDRYIAAALETGRVESNFTNVGHGDADSVNWRQERASIYGGDMSVRRSVSRFFDEASKLDKGQASYMLAADVQRPREDLRGRYKDAHGEAMNILGQYGTRTPNPGPSSSSQQPAASTTTTPGVDNSGLRRQLVGDFLSQGGVKNAGAVMQLVGQYGAAQDAPGTTTTSYTTGVGQDKPAPGSVLNKSTTGSVKALQWAESKIGQPGSKETGGENHGKLADYANSRFGMSGQPWCAMFTSLAVTKGGAPKNARTASVAEVRRQAEQGGGGYQKGFIDASRAKPGDMVLWGNDHIGMVQRVKGGKVYYVAGNESDTVGEGVADPGEVAIVRPKYGKRGKK